MKMTEWLRLKSGPDIRGDAMEHDGKSPTLTENVARCIGYAFALWLAERTHTTTDRLVISVGRDNGYGHPASETLERLTDIGSQVLRTDELGTIVIER